MGTQLYLKPRDRGRALSLEEFQRARSREGFHYELIDGKLEVSPVPDLPHDYLVGWLGNQLRAYEHSHPEVIRRVQAPGCVFVPGRSATTAPEPDIAAYRDFPTNLPIDQLRWQDVSPLLVVEVLSADTADKNLVRNRDLYVQVPSIREYWILDPRRRRPPRPAGLPPPGVALAAAADRRRRRHLHHPPPPRLLPSPPGPRVGRLPVGAGPPKEDLPLLSGASPPVASI
jgi:Uma2 family endonuclease